VARWYEPAGNPGLDCLASSAMIGGDDRSPHRLRLDDDPAEPLGIARSGNDDVGQLVCGRHVATLLDDAKEARKSAPFDRGLKLAAKPPSLLRSDKKAAD